MPLRATLTVAAAAIALAGLAAPPALAADNGHRLDNDSSFTQARDTLFAAAYRSGRLADDVGIHVAVRQKHFRSNGAVAYSYDLDAWTDMIGTGTVKTRGVFGGKPEVVNQGSVLTLNADTMEEVLVAWERLPSDPNDFDRRVLRKLPNSARFVTGVPTPDPGGYGGYGYTKEQIAASLERYEFTPWSVANTVDGACDPEEGAYSTCTGTVTLLADGSRAWSFTISEVFDGTANNITLTARANPAGILISSGYTTEATYNAGYPTEFTSRMTSTVKAEYAHDAPRPQSMRPGNTIAAERLVAAAALTGVRHITQRFQGKVINPLKAAGIAITPKNVDRQYRRIEGDFINGVLGGNNRWVFNQYIQRWPRREAPRYTISLLGRNGMASTPASATLYVENGELVVLGPRLAAPEAP